MKHRSISDSASAWMTLTVLVAVPVAVRGVRAMLGLAPFAWWYLPVIAAGVCFTLDSLEAADKAYLSALLRLMRMKAAASSLTIRTRLRFRAARGLAALLPLLRRPFNPKMHTEP